MHWVAAEATATAAALHAATGDPAYAGWYETWWQHVADHFLDASRVLAARAVPENQPSSVTWAGKPDIYHAFQATLIPRLPLSPTLADALAQGLLPSQTQTVAGSRAGSVAALRHSDHPATPQASIIGHMPKACVENATRAVENMIGSVTSTQAVRRGRKPLRIARSPAGHGRTRSPALPAG